MPRRTSKIKLSPATLLAIYKRLKSRSRAAKSSGLSCCLSSTRLESGSLRFGKREWRVPNRLRKHINVNDRTSFVSFPATSQSSDSSKESETPAPHYPHRVQTANGSPLASPVKQYMASEPHVKRRMGKFCRPLRPLCLPVYREPSGRFRKKKLVADLPHAGEK